MNPPSHLAPTALTGQGPLRVCLFGGLALSWGDAALPTIASLPARSLFAYLVTYRDRGHTRDLLAGTLWPDLPDAQARRRLSQALWQIGRVLHPLPSPAPYLLTAADTVQFNTAAPYWLDTEEFQAACSGFQDAQSANLQPETASLKRAVALYRGDFLAGFYDNWMVVERERLHELFLAALERLLELCKAGGAYEEALGYARRLIAEDLLHEEGHREVMRLCHLLGRSNEALRQYELCRTILAEELGAEPAAATTALYRQIAADVGSPEVPYLPQARSRQPSPLLEGTGPLPLVGRIRERAALVGYLERAIGDHGGLVLLEGEAGAGKTRLLQEVARDAEWRGMEVSWGRGRELADAPPYGPLVEALQGGLSPLRAGQLAQLAQGTRLREASQLLPELAEWLPGLPPHIALGPEQERARLLEALTRIVLALGQIAPHLLILEDLHWADEATLEALIHLAPQLATGRVLLVASYRSGETRAVPVVWQALQELERAGCQRIELAPLSAEETGEMIRHGLGLAQAAPRFEARLYKETAGNPLFVLETLRALHDEGLLYRDRAGEWRTPWDEITADYAELPLPKGVREVIARRLARLGPDEQAALNVAAVLGPEFDLGLLLGTSEQERQACLAAAGELVRRRLLDEGPSAYRFSHDQVRRVAYAGMPEAERRRLHRQAGEALEARQPQVVAALAYHFAQAQVADKAAAYGLLAGKQAQALYAYTEALARYDQALALADESDLIARWELHRQKEATLDVLGRREEQAASLAEMLRLAVALGDEQRRAVTLYRQGRLATGTGAPRQGLVLLYEANDLALGRGDLSLAGECQVMIGRAHWHLGEIPPCLAAAETAQTLFRQANDRRGEAGALNLMGNLYLGLLGNHEQALRCFEQVAALAQEMGDRLLEHSANCNAGIALMTLGCYRESQERLSRARAFFTQIDYPLYLAVIAFAQANNHLGLGERAAAGAVAEEGLALCREIGERNFAIENLRALGLAALARGDWPQARKRFEQAVEDAQAGQQRHDMALQQSYLALACLHLGEDEQAQALSAESVAVLEAFGPDVSFLEVVYFHRYRILARLVGAEAAQPYLERAWHALMERADAIESPELRRSFLENVPENREIVAAYRAWQAGEQPMRVRLPRAGAPTGRPLRDDEWVEVTWTVSASEDEAIRDKTGRRQGRLLRLLGEAAEQGAAPTIDDLAAALHVSRATIKRDLAGLRAAGQAVRTRGSRSRSHTTTNPQSK